MVNIRQNLLAAGKYAEKSPYSMDYTSVTVHNTANDASADNEVKNVVNNSGTTSFHYAVDEKEIVQAIPDDRSANHCGNAIGNKTSLSVEICHSKSGGTKFLQAEKNAAEFIAYKLKQKGMGIGELKTHQDQNGKYCPHRTLDMGLERFKDMVRAYLGGTGSTGSGTTTGNTASNLPNLSGYSGSSIVDALKSVGWDSSLTERKKLAAQVGISNYTGTAAQNTQLLNALKTAGSGSTGSGTTTGNTATNLPNLSGYSGSSIVDALKSAGWDSSLEERKKLAAQVGISNYTGTAAQNTQLLNALKTAGSGSTGSGTTTGNTATNLPNLSGYSGSSIVDALKSAGWDSSLEERKKLAAQVGISNYTGTAAQNTQLLKALR